jgi:hypothetical protein
MKQSGRIYNGLELLKGFLRVRFAIIISDDFGVFGEWFSSDLPWEDPLYENFHGNRAGGLCKRPITKGIRSDGNNLKRLDSV